MPTYFYECGKCGCQFEKFQKMTEDPLKSCPECKGKVKKLISTGSGVIFKGKGFYQTDYKPRDKKDGGTPAPCKNAGSCPCKE